MEIKISKIVRSKRKSIALIMAQDATLVVRAPWMTSIKAIEALVEKQKLWIQTKREQLLKIGISKPKRFVESENFLFLGKAYQLKIQNCWDIELSDELIFPERYLQKAKIKLIAWYKEQAFSKITGMAKHYSRISGWRYETINITSAERRWGSCSSSGAINFSWKLIMAPLDVVEYVVVHELAHITEKNHSARFWDKVKSILPAYQTQEKWLKVNGQNLSL